MTRILITGCSGFLAGHLIPLLQQDAENRLFGLTEVAGFARPGLQVRQCDIREEEKLLALVGEVKPDLVFHLAGVTNVAFSWKNPRPTYEINFLGSGNLFEALKRHSPGARVVAMSSAEVYKVSDRPISEAAAIAPRNPYSLSKYAMEMLAGIYHETAGLPVVIIRAFNFTGPGQESRFVASDFAAQVAAIEKGRQEPIVHVGNLGAVRDFSDVRDIAAFLQVLARQGEPGQVYNLCSGRGQPISRILEMLLSFSACSIRMEVDPERFRPLDNPLMIGDNWRINSEFGLKPQIPIEETLRNLLDYWRAAP